MAKKSEIKKINENMRRLATNGEVYFADYMSGTVVGDEKPKITVDLRHGNPIFQAYSSHRSLSPDLIDYVESVVQYIPLRSHLVITFLISKNDEELKKRIQSEFVGYFSFDFNQKLAERKRGNRLIATFVALGVLLLVVYGALTAYSSRITPDTTFNNWLAICDQILSIASWVFLWEAFDRILFEQPKASREAFRAAQLANAEIVFVADHRPAKSNPPATVPSPVPSPANPVDVGEKKA